MINKRINVGLVTDGSKKSKDIISKFENIFSINPVDAGTKFIIVIGGDGTMIHAIHQYIHLNIPFYGIKTGNLGFLMNIYDEEMSDFKIDLNRTQSIVIDVLEMNIVNTLDEVHEEIAINEVSLLRQTHQAANIEISINNKIQLEKLVSDGIIISTPAGSTAYNFSAGGLIVPIGGNMLALTPISPFRPRKWNGALLSKEYEMLFKVLNYEKRPVSATADFIEFRNVKEVRVKINTQLKVTLLFEAKQNLNDRIIKEQFFN